MSKSSDLLMSKPGKTRAHYVEEDKEDTSFRHEANTAAIRVRDVAAILVESDSAIASHQVRDAEDRRVHLCVLEGDVEQGSIVLTMDNTDLALVRYE